MKKLPIPNYDDNKNAREASKNSRMSSFPYLENELDVIIQAYDDYQRCSGNVITTPKSVISRELQDGLKAHYKSEADCFSFIGVLRNSSRRVCPMCGSLGTGTLDHLFPQKHFPEFAVFSKNLVPACDCNSKRKDAYTGVSEANNTPVRVLHPYYDDFLSTRQITFSITPEPEYPIVKFSLVYLNENEPYFPSVKYHVEKVVLPSGIIKEMGDMWASLSEYPCDKIQTLPEFEIIDNDTLSSCLASALRRHDRQKSTENNWESIFIHSIINNQQAQNWIVEKHNQIVMG